MLVSVGLAEKVPQDYRLAQQVCCAIANISDRRKVCGGYNQTARVEILLSALHTLAFCLVLYSLLWANDTLPSGCLRSTGCLSDFRSW
jgi:hypothetical protein